MFLIDKEKLFFGAAINYNDICWIYPLKIKEIIGMGVNSYNEKISLLCSDIGTIQKELKKEGVPIEDMCSSAFEYLLLQAYVDRTFLVKLQEAFFTFIKEKVRFLFDEKEILIGDDFSERRVLNEDNFEDFQNILREQNRLPVPEPIPKNETPMARKFRLRREQVAEAKRRQAEKEGEIITLIDSISTLMCLVPGTTEEEIKRMSIYQFKERLSRAQARYKYDLDIRMIAAGADPKKIKPKHWFGKIDF
jgi:hypothetical protein